MYARLIPLALFIFGLCTCARAQSSATETRWHFGLEAGRHFSTPTWVGNPAATGYYQGHAKYRALRWLDVGLHLGYHRLAGTTETQLFLYGTDSPTSAVELRQRNLLLGFNTSYNLRLGQGDLSVTFTYGYLRHAAHHDIINTGGETDIRMDYAAEHGMYYQLGLDYTYWLNPRIGCRAGVSWLRLEHGKSDENFLAGSVYAARRGNRTVATPEEFAQLDGLFTIGYFQPREYLYANLGLVLRPF